MKKKKKTKKKETKKKRKRKRKNKIGISRESNPINPVVQQKFKQNRIKKIL